MKKIVNRLFGALLAVLLLVALVPSGSAEAEQQTIRVAFPTQEGMSFIGHSGKVGGYNYDYLEKISEYTGWQMEYVPYGSADGNEAVSSALADLQDGKVDLMGPLLKNAATEKMFEFPKNSYGTVYTTLNALSSGSLRETNLHDVGVLRVGLWKSAETRNSEVLAYLESEKLGNEIVYFDTYDEQQQALIGGDVDVVSSVSLSPVANARIVAQFAPRPYYFASTKGNTALIEKLDETIALIDQVDSNLQDNLYNNYFRVVNEEFRLTEAQKQTFSQLGTLKVLCAENSAPFACRKDGVPAGMLVSILNDFGTQVGVTIDYTFCDSRENAWQKLREGQYDAIVGIPLTSGVCAQLGFINSSPAIEAALAYAQNPTSGGGDNSTKTIAMVEGLQEQIVTDEYKAVILCDDSKSCLEAVESGKANIAAGTRAALEYYIYERDSNLVTSQIPGQNLNANISISRQNPSEVLAALNNYLYSISESELAAYLSEGNLHSGGFTLGGYVRRHPTQTVLVVAGVTAAMVAIIFFFRLRAIREKSELERVHNVQLQEALQIAQDANEAKTNFLSNMSHDIRTPMNAVIGFSTLLSREPDNAVKVREYTRKIGVASNHLLGLINDILDISKIESGKLTLRESVFSLDELLESVNVVVRPLAGEKKQQLMVNMGKMSHELFAGDKTRLNQVLINLLSNAIKYTPAGGQIRFSIEDLGPSSSKVERIRFVVEDTGYGITDEFKKIIFEPFTRSEGSTTNKETGTGLGLAITKNIVDLMGGSIDLESVIGKGSTFTVELPMRLPHEEADEHFWENHGMTKILLVDDDKSVCDGVKANMAGSGVTLDAVYSGEAAVEKVKKEYAAGREYSAIILDWQMPGMNGLDVAKIIRKIIPIDTPAMFLTSYDWTEIETEALEIDVDGFLAKPFTAVNLKEKLIEVEHFKNAVSKEDVSLNLKGLHFLLAEDNKLNAEIVVELLKSEGASCDVAENGRLVVDRFRESAPKTYDAILMDVMMPVMNGYEATKAIRASKHPEALTIPIVAMTANAFAKDVQDALDAGMNAHVAKPINMETLKNTLGSCIGR